MAKLVSIVKKAVNPGRMNKKRLARSYSNGYSSSSSWDQSDLESDNEDMFPVNVPHGCFAVYAGAEARRFVVRMEHLNHPLFRALLEKTAEEYGFDQAGALSIPCEAVLFEHILWLLNNKDSQANKLEIDVLLTFYSS